MSPEWREKKQKTEREQSDSTDESASGTEAPVPKVADPPGYNNAAPQESSGRAERPSSAVRLKEKVLIGGAGTSMPLLANLYILDAKQILSDFELIVFLGYMLKAVLCFGAGCLIGYLHQQENNRFTLFQLGLGVPALLLALLNGSQYAEAQSKAPEQEPGITQGAPQPGLSLLSFSVYADSHELLTFETPEQTAFEKLMRGFGFSVPERDHFVIVGA